MKFQIDPTAQRMETGKEAPCRRFYQENNNPYGLEEFESMRTVKEFIDKRWREGVEGVDKFKNDGVDTETEKELDDPLQPFNRRSFWNRPEWFRDSLSFWAHAKETNLFQYYKDALEEDSHKEVRRDTLWYRLKRYMRIAKDRSVSTTPERLGEVLKQIWDETGDGMIRTNPADPEAGHMHPIADAIHGQLSKIRLAYRQSWKEFWREFPPLPTWKVPSGAAEPDPHINVMAKPPNVLFRDAVLGSSAQENLLDVMQKAYTSPLSHPIRAVKIFSVRPPVLFSADSYIEEVVKLREAERRNSNDEEVIQGMLPVRRPVLDMLYDHAPGWNHATHGWEYGRRLPMIREAAEQAEFMARWPEPLSETAGHDAIPRHMQTFHQWMAFPDPYYSHFAYISRTDDIEAHAKFSETDSVYLASQHFPPHLRVDPPHTKRKHRAHWEYFSSPEAAYDRYYGAPIPGIEPTIKEHLHYDETMPLDLSFVHGDAEHLERRANRQASTPAEVVQAFQHIRDNASPWQMHKLSSRPILAVKGIWTWIRHGKGFHDESTMLARSLAFIKEYTSLSKKEKITISKVAADVVRGAVSSTRQRKQNLKDSLGLNEEKIAHMSDYLVLKDEAKRRGITIAQLQREISQYEQNAPPSDQSDASSSATDPTRPQHTATPGARAQSDSERLQNLASYRSDKLKNKTSTPISSSSYVSSPKSNSSTSKKGSRSYSTNSSARGKLGINFTMPWTIQKRAYSVEASPKNSKIKEPVFSSAWSEFKRMKEAEMQKRRTVDVTPTHTRNSAVNFSSDPTVYTERADLDALVKRATAAASTNSTNSESPDWNVYANNKSFGSTSLRAPPVTSRESYFRALGRMEGAPAPFLTSAKKGDDPAVPTIPPSESRLAESHPQSYLAPGTPGTSFKDAVWGISKAFGRVVSNLIRDVVDERLANKVGRTSTLEQDMSKVVEWHTRMAKDEFWNRYRNDFASKTRTIYSSLPRLAPTLSVLYQAIHPTGDAAQAFYDPTAKEHMLEIDQQEFDSRNGVLMYVLSQLSAIPQPPLLGPGYEERAKKYVEQVKKLGPDSPVYEILKTSPYNREKTWSEALHRIFEISDISTDKDGTNIAESVRHFDERYKKLMAAVANKVNAAKHARSALEGIGVLDAADRPATGAEHVRRDGKTGMISGLSDPSSLWTDPKVRYHDPQTWKAMRQEFEIFDAEAMQHQQLEMERELQKRQQKSGALFVQPLGDVLTDFERMLFQMQPFVDRLMAHPTDPKARVFFIMKLESLASSPMLRTEWMPSADSESAENDWWHDFGRKNTHREFTDMLDEKGRVRTVVDEEPTSLTELLLQLGVSPNRKSLQEERSFHHMYKAHIDHPFLYLKADGSFVDLNEDGSMDPLLSLAQGVAPATDHVHKQSSSSPYRQLKDLLHADPLFLAKSWVRTMAHIRYQQQVNQTWNPLADDSELPSLIIQLEKRLADAKRIRDEGTNKKSKSSDLNANAHGTDVEANEGVEAYDEETEREYETMRDLIQGLSNDIKTQRSNSEFTSSEDVNQSTTSLLGSLPPREELGLSKSDYYTLGGMVAAFDPTIRNFVPPPMQSMQEAYLEAASTPSAKLDELLASMHEERNLYENQMESLISAAQPKPDFSRYNPYLYMPYERIPVNRSLSTRWKGAEPLILHAPLMPYNIATGLMQYMISLKRNMADPDMKVRLQAWLSVRPELLPYIAHLSKYNERFVKAVLDGEPLPYGEDLEKTFFHWTVTDYVQHYTSSGYMEDLRADQLMALSDLNVLLFGSDSEKKLLQRKRRDLQRIALTQLEQKINGSPAAESLSTSPTLFSAEVGGEEKNEYTLLQRIRNTLKVLGKDLEGGIEGENGYKPLQVLTREETPKSKEELDFMRRVEEMDEGAIEAKYHHLGHERAAIQRYRDEFGWNEDDGGGPNAGFSRTGEVLLDATGKPLPNQDQIRVRRMGKSDQDNPQAIDPEATVAYIQKNPLITSSASLASESENIEILKARFLQHPMAASSLNASDSKGKKGSVVARKTLEHTPIPKDMLPLAGLDPTDWLKPVSAQDVTLQRLHLLPFDPNNKATYGNYPYNWAEDGGALDRGMAADVRGEVTSDQNPYSDRNSSNNYSASATNTGGVSASEALASAMLAVNPQANVYASLLAPGASGISIDDLLSLPMTASDDTLAEHDEGVKLARRAGDPELIREARYLFTLRGADMNNHGDERTIRLHEFHTLKTKSPNGLPASIPPRVVMPPEFELSAYQRYSQVMKDEADARAWVRKRYSSWLGQDPLSRTFDLRTALDPDHAYFSSKEDSIGSYTGPKSINDRMRESGVADRAAIRTEATLLKNPFTDTTLAVPNPSTIWGPTHKSFFDLEQELRLQLSLSVPKDVEDILEEEKQKFISDLEAQLVAYKAMEKAALSRGELRATQEKLQDVDKRLRTLELQWDSAAARQEGSDDISASELVGKGSFMQVDEFMEQIAREREALQREKEELRMAAVQLSDVTKTTPDSQDDSWVRLQDALDRLKTMSTEYEVATKRVTDELEKSEAEPMVGPEGALMNVEQPEGSSEYEKTPEQQAFDDEMEERKKARLKREEEAKSPKSEDEIMREMREEMGPPTKKSRRGVRTQHLYAYERKEEKKKPRWARRWTPASDLTIRERPEPVTHEDRRIWKKSYATVTMDQMNAFWIDKVHEFSTQILNATPQVVRLACSPEVIPMIERFYREEYPQITVTGASPPFCAEHRWAPRPEDEAYTSLGLWVTPVYYSTVVHHKLINQIRYRQDLAELDMHATFVGSMFVLVASTPEDNFQVVDFRFDMDVPDLPDPVHPNRGVVTPKDLELRRIDVERQIVPPEMAPYAPQADGTPFPPQMKHRPTPPQRMPGNPSSSSSRPPRRKR